MAGTTVSITASTASVNAAPWRMLTVACTAGSAGVPATVKCAERTPGTARACFSARRATVSVSCCHWWRASLPNAEGEGAPASTWTAAGPWEAVSGGRAATALMGSLPSSGRPPEMCFVTLTVSQTID